MSLIELLTGRREISQCLEKSLLSIWKSKKALVVVGAFFAHTISRSPVDSSKAGGSPEYEGGEEQRSVLGEGGEGGEETVEGVEHHGHHHHVPGTHTPAGVQH